MYICIGCLVCEHLCVKTEGGVCVVRCRHYEFVNILHWVCVVLYEFGLRCFMNIAIRHVHSEMCEAFLMFSLSSGF